MSEKIYAWLLRVFPAHFLKTYREDALQLYRDRSRDERGLLPKLRLWLDLLGDLAVSVPREYRRVEPALAGSTVPQRSDGMPGFELLESELPRPGAVFSGLLLSLATFAAVSVLIVHGGSHAVLRIWGNQSGPESTVGASASSHPARLPATKNEEKIAAGDAAGGSGLALARASEPKPQDATSAILQAFQTHNIVMFGETHGNKQEYEWLCQLVQSPDFGERVDDVVVEFGNSLYQKTVDRYIAGEDVPLDQVQKAWRNVIGAVGPPSPVYEQFYRAVREANMKRRGRHQIRMVLGDPYGDWDKIKDSEDLGPYVAHRDEWYAQIVKDEVLAKNHRALLIMGAGHFLRRSGPGYVEREIRAAGANPYLVIFGTNAVGGYDELDVRFDAWPRPTIVSLASNWVGDLPQNPVTTGGILPATQLRLGDAADALLYVGSRDTLTQLNMPRAELEGTPYEKEIARRIMIQAGHPMNFLSDQAESPQYVRPQAQANGASRTADRPGPPPMPKSMNDPLPPRPPSQ
jgi:hypothetical protein